jgi:hypothetical protein
MGQSILSVRSEHTAASPSDDIRQHPPELHFAVVPNNPHGFVVETGIRRPIVRDKMQMPEQETFHRRIAKMAVHRLLDDRQIVFIHDLVGLNVERPLSVQCNDAMLVCWA